ncbi:MAG: tRNA (N6-isopentenyl adenosine(37)-C2)-methylthiotransferase MiaB [Firmicutes bacterium]|nr:tRNA (N6-isopentenyl adenosine(37)-C2)-methylthiotransferase MiaB [Bacillota bacterium]
MEVKRRSARVVTFGCQMNERDSETIMGILSSLGFEESASVDDADIIIFVTCCVRENAENRALGNLGETKRLKERNPHLVVGMCGCMAQRSDLREEVKARMPWVDLMFGTHNIHRLPELLQRVFAGERVVEVWNEPCEVVEGLPAVRAYSHKAFVNITYGCDNFCTYCIVPYVRGRERSRTIDDVVAEVRDLAESGCAEVTLLGQNVNSYGRGLPPLSSGVSPDFADLLYEVNSVEELKRIRFTTSHPRDFTDKMVEAACSCDKVCEHFHLPLQAGSDRVLDMMHRGYTAEKYLGLVHRIRSVIPGASITTDIMVGFPGETEADFQDTMDMVRQARFDAAFTFIYSPRPGTVAAEMPNQVEDDVKHDRIYRLIDLVNSIAGEINDELRGAITEVMVEGPSERDPSVLSGRTRTNKMVHWTASREHKPGDLVKVRIVEPRTWTLYGEEVMSGGEVDV